MHLGEFEELVLLTVVILRGKAYGIGLIVYEFVGSAIQL